jgi:hypothetical protein
LMPWERHALFSVGVGCPSYGGQRTVRGDLSRLLFGLVTGQQPWLPAKQSA